MRHPVARQQVRLDHFRVVHHHHVRHHHRDTRSVQRLIIPRLELRRRPASLQRMVGQRSHQLLRVGQQLIPHPFGQRLKRRVVRRKQRQRALPLQRLHQPRRFHRRLQRAQLLRPFHDLPQRRHRHRHLRVPARRRAPRVGYLHRINT